MSHSRSTDVRTAEIQHAFLDNERNVRIQNYRVACVLAMVFMPAGLSLDWFVYPDYLVQFLKLRILASALLLFLWWFVSTVAGRGRYRLLGLLLPAVPSFFISWMIFLTEGASSTYYAGLNLVLLGMALVLRWTVWDSIIVFLEVVFLYTSACFLHRAIQITSTPLEFSTFFNNVYFLIVTGVFTVIGTYFYNRIRFREFALRFELESNRRIIEENNRKLVELDQAKSRFFANISHELRTPLTLLLAPLQSIRSRYGHILDSDALDLLASMKANGMRLLKLINDLLDLVRLEEGSTRIERSPVNVQAFVRGIAVGVQHTAETRNIKVGVSVADSIPTLMVDRDKLEKILLNLLFNALKFTNSGGSVDLDVVTDADNLVLSVRDTGIGISREDLKKLFQRFWQADSSAHRKYQGAGIGLALVKELSEAQGGSVTVESEVGTGTVFTVRLPLLLAAEDATDVESDTDRFAKVLKEPVEESESDDNWLKNLYRRAQLYPADSAMPHLPRSQSGTNGTPRSKVLVADDEPDMLRFLSAELGEDYEVIEAVNGRIAVERATTGLPDVIVLDMMMPELDGLSACRKIREHEATRHTPIIMLTARADEDTKLGALEAGANDFLSKPFSVTELHVRVRNLIEGYQSRRELATQNSALEGAMEQLRELEMQLLQSEKLASLGELSAGMSHEIKNPLNYALTGVYALRQKAALVNSEERTEYEELVGSVEEGVRRVMGIVNDLRQLAHPHLGVQERVMVTEVVDTALRLLRAEWGGKVTIHRSVNSSLAVQANRSMMVIVLLNLVKNAIDALAGKAPGNGEPAIWIETESADGRAIVRVRDNGPGIATEHQQRIFDVLGMGDFASENADATNESQGRVFKHFFTTKGAGAGMGMGLSICRRIVRAFNGRITFRSEPGRMCEFSLDFPAVEAEVKQS